MNSFSEFIKDKSVCFVGACPNLSGRGMGPSIDSFDVVVKTNGSIWLNSAEYLRDYGSRVDVLYTNNQFAREMRAELPKIRGIKFMRMKSCKPNDLIALREHYRADIINDAIHTVNRKVKSALMGCYLIQDILQARPASLFLTGIDFFESKKQVFEHDNYREYLTGYLPQRIREQGNKINKGKTKDGHDAQANTRFVYDLWSEGKVSMPDFIEKAMKRVINAE